MRRPKIPWIRAAFDDDRRCRSRAARRRSKRPSSETRPPGVSASKTSVSESGWPDISRATSTPRPPVSSRDLGARARPSRRPGRSTTSAPIAFARLARIGLTSVAITVSAPKRRSRPRWPVRPIGPQPVTRTDFPARSSMLFSGRSEWTAFPRGSWTDAIAGSRSGRSSRRSSPEAPRTPRRPRPGRRRRPRRSRRCASGPSGTGSRCRRRCGSPPRRGRRRRGLFTLDPPPHDLAAELVAENHRDMLAPGSWPTRSTSRCERPCRRSRRPARARAPRRPRALGRGPFGPRRPPLGGA